MKRALIAVAALVAAFGIVTWWALEAGDVALIETRAADRTVRFTHVWHVELDGEVWLEAGSPENGWFEDIQHNPVVHLVVDGHAVRYAARPVEDVSARQRVRSALRKKYGLRDRWVALLVDSDQAVAVHLLPAPE